MSKNNGNKPVIEMPTDYPIHSKDRPFCDDMSCPCHTDSDEIEALGKHVEGGLATTKDADRIYRGKNV